MPSTHLGDLVRRVLRSAAPARDAAAAPLAETIGLDPADVYRLVVENSQDLISMVDVAGRFVFLSPSIERVLGYAAADLLGTEVLRIVHPDDVEAATATIETSLETGSAEVSNVRVRHKDGTWRVVEGVAGAVFDDDGAPKLIISTSRDVTERRMVEVAAERSRIQLEIILRSVADAITVQNRDGTLVFANEAAAGLLGFSSSTALLASETSDRLAPFEVLSEDGEALSLETLPGRTALRTRRDAEQTIRYRVRESREERWSIVRAIPFVNERGEAEYVINTFHDITERVRSERRLQFLAEASALLGASLDWEATLASVARLSIPALADWCIVDVLDEDGHTIRQVAVAAADPAKEDVLREMRALYQPTIESPQPAAEALRTSKTSHYESFTPESLAATARDENHLRLLRKLDPKAAVAVPLIARGHTIGAITLAWSESTRAYSETDVSFAEELAGRAALAVDNARLYDAAQETARRNEETLALLDTLLATAPIGLAFLDREFRFVRANEALARLNGIPVEDHLGRTSHEVAPDLAPRLEALWSSILETGDPALDLELSGRTPATAGELQHWLGSYYPVRAVDGEIVGIGAVVVDVSERQRADERQRFLVEASTLLSSSLDYEVTLARVARLSIPHLADWCTIDMVGEDGEIRRLVTMHHDPDKIELAAELQEKFPVDPGAAYGVPNVIRTGQSELFAEIPDELLVEATSGDEELLQVLRELGLRSSMCVPLVARGRALGAITFVSEAAGRRFDDADLAFAEELAWRAAIAVDNARLFHEAELRGDAARVLSYVADGVFMLDREEVVRLWNPAAELITGLDAATIVGRRVTDAIPGWSTVAERIPVAAAPAPGGTRAQTVPLELSDRELWISISGVGFHDGIVYAFRDLTEERALEELRSDFVSTVSHELRTPLAAIYGAALTLRRDDLKLAPAQHENLLAVIVNEADRLARTINDILWASRLDSATLQIAIESCDPVSLARGVVAAAETHLPPEVELDFAPATEIPKVRADPDKVRQVLVNLVDNAVKYSPDGGRVAVELEPRGRVVRFAVHDQGLGVPQTEQRRIFDKFYRLDPNMTRGVGGTGLGLYICRELVQRMEGRIWVDSRGEGQGSTFAFELPAADGVA